MLNSGPAVASALLATAAMTVAGCGGSSEFKNDPRPPATLQLTGVITEDSVTISPNRVGAGPVILVISNQTQEAHTISLDGGGTVDRVGPINPLDTAKVQQTLRQGTYTVKAGSSEAASKEIKPGNLVVGAERKSSSDQVLLP